MWIQWENLEISLALGDAMEEIQVLREIDGLWP